MSINWVMLSNPQTYIKLPHEKQLGTATRVSLSITTPRTYPANNPINITSSSGTLYLTNQRVIYIPTNPTTHFQSFSAPILNLHDTHITVSWFGPNIWSALIQPVAGGNLDGTSHAAVELKLTFKEGGAPDFQSTYERVKERLQQAVEAARDSGVDGRRSGMPNGVDMTSVHLDQLPSYEASGHDRVAPLGGHDGDVPLSRGDVLDRPQEEAEGEVVSSTTTAPHNASIDQPPSDAPPGYEETQRQSVEQEIERRLSGS